MTVAELIAELQKLDPSMKVMRERTGDDYGYDQMEEVEVLTFSPYQFGGYVTKHHLARDSDDDFQAVRFL